MKGFGKIALLLGLPGGLMALFHHPGAILAQARLIAN
jgi:hypothetical protein